MKVDLAISNTEHGSWKYYHDSTESQIKLTLTKMMEWEIQGQETENKQEIWLSYGDIDNLIELLEKIRK